MTIKLIAIDIEVKALGLLRLKSTIKMPNIIYPISESVPSNHQSLITLLNYT
jgi:hypothetical protein